MLVICVSSLICKFAGMKTVADPGLGRYMGERGHVHVNQNGYIEEF